MHCGRAELHGSGASTTLGSMDWDDLRYVLAIARQISSESYGYPNMQLKIVLPNSLEHGYILTCSVEDTVCGEVSYVDHLCHLHREVQVKLD